jgi:hypothetical protein
MEASNRIFFHNIPNDALSRKANGGLRVQSSLTTIRAIRGLCQGFECLARAENRQRPLIMLMAYGKPWDFSEAAKSLSHESVPR